MASATIVMDDFPLAQTWHLLPASAHFLSLTNFSLRCSSLDLSIQVIPASATGPDLVVLRSDLSSATLDFNFCFSHSIVCSVLVILVTSALQFVRQF